MSHKLILKYGNALTFCRHSAFIDVYNSCKDSVHRCSPPHTGTGARSGSFKADSIFGFKNEMHSPNITLPFPKLNQIMTTRIMCLIIKERIPIMCVRAGGVIKGLEQNRRCQKHYGNV